MNPTCTTCGKPHRLMYLVKGKWLCRACRPPMLVNGGRS